MSSDKVISAIERSNRTDIADINEKHKQEMDQLTEALNNNTLAIQKLTDYIEAQDDKRN